MVFIRWISWGEQIMTENQKREEISKAYVAAVAAKCGFKIGTWSQDDDCLDVTIGAAGKLGRGTLAGPKLDIQLKSSSNQVYDKGDTIRHQLTRDRYDNLRLDSCTPKILVFLLLPEEENEWIEHSVEALTMRRCAYWSSLKGREEIPEGTKSTSIFIPKKNIFSPETLYSLMEKISSGEGL
ncbi:MAG TPA: hypothetical protein DCE42_22055 [Myxococcales bacterium]|nr:hypothetical protein [Deltaproteobacteria bacterium]HAA57465.1 hypothetical protein [Myxococcales bacterium]|tara:strand:+ start:536 stop:1081 length:546 start_codon:yes stop_codon:yes gene_type:complete